jgi:hypothetical protein
MVGRVSRTHWGRGVGGTPPCCGTAVAVAFEGKTEGVVGLGPLALWLGFELVVVPGPE